MNDIAPLTALIPDADTTSGQEALLPPTTIIVSQVKSNRVVYFTDDLDYQPPMEGDWYYVSTYQGPLPKDMTLRNCWGWRFNGGVFKDAREAPRQSAAESLLENNRKALRRLLREKIDARARTFPARLRSGRAGRAPPNLPKPRTSWPDAIRRDWLPAAPGRCRRPQHQPAAGRQAGRCQGRGNQRCPDRDRALPRTDQPGHLPGA